MIIALGETAMTTGTALTTAPAYLSAVAVAVAPAVSEERRSARVVRSGGGAP